MHEDKLKYLGELIRSARKECNLTQQELADQTNIGLRHIQNIEKGKIIPSYEILSTLIKRLGLSPDALFYPNDSTTTKNIKHLLGKFLACTEDEQQILLRTLDCMADEFLKRHTSSKHSILK